MRWCLLVVLICMSLVTNEWPGHSLPALMGHLHIFFRKVSIQTLCPIFNGVILLLLLGPRPSWPHQLCCCRARWWRSQGCRDLPSSFLDTTVRKWREAAHGALTHFLSSARLAKKFGGSSLHRMLERPLWSLLPNTPVLGHEPFFSLWEHSTSLSSFNHLKHSSSHMETICTIFHTL